MATHPTILLIEDDTNDVLFMKTAFEAAAVTNPVQQVSDGKQAFAYLSGAGRYANRRRYPLPYLVLVDLKLPQVMGLQLVKWIRQRSEFASTIVLVLTASTNPSDIDQAYLAGANGFLIKPSSFEKLKAMAQAIKDFWLLQNQQGSAFYREG